MTRQVTSNIGLTYEDDKSKTFSYDNDIKNNMITIDGEMDSAKDRLTDIENNTELPQFTPLLTQESSVFSIGTGRDEFGVAVDASDNISKGQVRTGVKGNSVNQIVKNSDFTDTSNLIPIASTLSASNNTLSVIGDGTNAIVQVNQTTNTTWTSNLKVFGKGKIRVTNDSCNQLVFKFYNSSGGSETGYVISNPVANKWYSVSEIYKETLGWTGKVSISMQAHYSDAEASNGKVMEVEEVMVVDMTVEGLGSLTTDEMNAKFPNWLKSGTNSTLSSRVRSVGKNIFDLDKIVLDTSTEMYKTSSSIVMNPIATYRQANIWIPVKPSTSYTLTASMSGGTNSPHIVFYGNAIAKDVVPPSYQGILNMADTELTVTTTSDAKYILLSCRNREITSSIFSNIQLEQNTTSTTYEPYKESISYITLPEGEELRSLPNDIKDEIFDGKLYKRTKKLF